VWGEIEHQLGYKPGQSTEFSVARQFRVISAHLSALDDHFDFVYDRLRYLQSRSIPDSSDLLNAENLPKVLEDFECRCEQDEIAGMLEILGTWDVRTVGELRARARGDILEAIRSEYSIQQGHGHRPTAFHIVSTLACLSVNATPADARKRLAANLQFVKLTERTRRKTKDEGV